MNRSIVQSFNRSIAHSLPSLDCDRLVIQLDSKRCSCYCHLIDWSCDDGCQVCSARPLWTALFCSALSQSASIASSAQATTPSRPTRPRRRFWTSRRSPSTTRTVGTNLGMDAALLDLCLKQVQTDFKLNTLSLTWEIVWFWHPLSQ